MSSWNVKCRNENQMSDPYYVEFLWGYLTVNEFMFSSCQSEKEKKVKRRSQECWDDRVGYRFWPDPDFGSFPSTPPRELAWRVLLLVASNDSGVRPSRAVFLAGLADPATSSSDEKSSLPVPLFPLSLLFFDHFGLSGPSSSSSSVRKVELRVRRLVWTADAASRTSRAVFLAGLADRSDPATSSSEEKSSLPVPLFPLSLLFFDHFGLSGPSSSSSSVRKVELRVRRLVWTADAAGRTSRVGFLDDPDAIGSSSS